ncbi:hypothetical protein RQP46_010426 [Phenoliferia psychrophenolica]
MKDLTTLAELQELVKSQEGQVVKAIAPTYQALAGEYSTLVGFAQVDVDDALELSEAYSIRTMPTFVVLKEGKQVEVLKGSSPAP